MGTVGVDEAAAEVDNLFATPADDHTGLLGDGGHHRGLEVLFVGIFQHQVDILGVDHHSHTLLALADGQLGAVQAGIFLGHAVEVNLQAVGQLADGHTHAAGAEVVALLDNARHLLAAEQALYLALGGGVALLHLGAAGREALGGVALGGTCGTADTVAAGAAAQQDDDIARVGGEALHGTARRGGDNGADFHALGHIVGMVYLVHQAGGEANLVAVAAVAMGGGGDNLTLRQFAGEGLVEGLGGVGSAGHTHGLVDVGAAAQRVADAAAEAGGRTAEGLDLGRVVVGLVLEVDEPLLAVAVDGDRHHDGAGVDFVARLLVVEDAGFLQALGGEGADVHQADKLVRATGIMLLMVGQVLPKGALDERFVKALVEVHILQLGGEGGMAAVVAPIGVEHADLGHRRVAVLLVMEVALDMLEVGEGHG